jgi:hypothetical protein
VPQVGTREALRQVQLITVRMTNRIHPCVNREEGFGGFEAVGVRTDKNINGSRTQRSMVIDSVDARADQFTSRGLNTYAYRVAPQISCVTATATAIARIHST